VPSLVPTTVPANQVSTTVPCQGFTSQVSNTVSANQIFTTVASQVLTTVLASPTVLGCATKVSTATAGSSKDQINPFNYVNTEHLYAAPKPLLVDNSIAISDDSNIWVKVKDISLTNADKRILASGQTLTDKQINVAQRLLKEAFPKVNGLRLTLLQNQDHKEATVNRIQILHINGNHWVCAATTSKGKLVHVYDSSYTGWDKSSYKMLQTQFYCSPCNIKFANVQKQFGSTDCGLFSIAYATSVAFQEDPSQKSYNQDLMCEHLMDCFYSKKYLSLSII